MTESTRSSLPGLYILTMVTMVGYGAIFSLLAVIRDDFGLTSAGVGFIGASAFASGFVAQLLLSRYADLGYGGLMLRVGVVICIGSSIWMIFADSLWAWMASRGILGFGAAITRPSIRRLVVVSDPLNAGRGLGILSAYEMTGFLIGPVLGAVLNMTFGLSSTFIVLSILFALCTPFTFNVEIPAAKNLPDKYVMLELLKRPAMQSCIAMGIAFWITVGVFEAIWAIFLSDLGASQLFIGLSMTVFGIPVIFIAPRAGAMAQQKGPLNIAIFSIGVAIACMISYGMIDSIWVICIPLVIHSIADAYTMPATQMAVALASGEDAIATGQGLFGATSMIVGAVTAGIGGIVYQETGASGLWFISGIAMIFLMLFAWFRGNDLKQPEELIEIK
ncbi:MAG: MFS transporter [Gammaproteobacteria bacterium]|jgi:MFS transporter, DHA1 family, multidrug resistance protein|nr:MFS transporter [Gammaproteobacteria bacterium]MBT4492177.1 MFS transporter [Gammaproteobacteria bacterium]MBT7369693.1 MFS transporter [Gammaproteobacteria bacterium]